MNIKIISILVVCAILSAGCIGVDEEEVKKNFSNDMMRLVMTMPDVGEDCSEWICDTEKHLKEVKKNKKILFTDMNGGYDSDKYDKYVSGVQECIDVRSL